VLSGPSGSGKSTLASALLSGPAGRDGLLVRSVSVTTRPPRPGEAHGIDYHFVSEDEFARLASRGDLLAQARVYGYRYGIRRAFVEEQLDRGTDVLLLLDVKGKRQLARSHTADVVSIFLLPPPLAELKRRLRDRGKDAGRTNARRLAAVGD